MGNPEGEQPSQDRPVGQLIRDASEQMSRLVREEAVASVKEDIDALKEGLRR